MPEQLDTRTQTVHIRTNRGQLTIGPHSRITGLWTICRRELLTNEQTRKLCGNIERGTLIRWRAHREFPKPVMRIKARGGRVELWSRSDVQAWLKSSRVETGRCKTM